MESSPLEKREKFVKHACAYFMMKRHNQDEKSAKITATQKAFIHMQQEEKSHAERQLAQEFSIREGCGMDPRLWEALKKYHES